MSAREKHTVDRTLFQGEGRTIDRMTDQRLLRGTRTRRAILRHAVDVASLDGLTGLSFGRLAADLSISKSGVQTLFPTKENLQLAVAGFAREAFHDAVIAPARDAPPGAARVRALVDRWIEYARAPLFAGGCFWAANLPDFDSRPGPVRDLLLRHQRGWRRVIADELRAAGATADDADLAAFQIDAVLVAANTALRFGDDTAVDTVRRVVDGLVPDDVHPITARRSQA
jgi:AcrR family transcriptional regulator